MTAHDLSATFPGFGSSFYFGKEAAIGRRAQGPTAVRPPCSGIHGCRRRAVVADSYSEFVRPLRAGSLQLQALVQSESESQAG